MTRRAASRALSILDEAECRDDVSSQHAPQHRRMKDLVGEDLRGGGGKGAVLEAVYDEDVGPRRADLQLEGELQNILLRGEGNIEDVFLLRLNRRSAFSFDGVGDEIPVDLVAPLEEQADLFGLRGKESALPGQAVGPDRLVLERERESRSRRGAKEVPAVVHVVASLSLTAPHSNG